MVDWQIGGNAGREIRLKKQVSTLEPIRTGSLTMSYFIHLLAYVAYDRAAGSMCLLCNFRRDYCEMGNVVELSYTSSGPKSSS